MCTDVMYYPCQITTYGKLFFTLVVKTTCVRLGSLVMKNHSSFFFQNEEILVQLDELDKLNRITHV